MRKYCTCLLATVICVSFCFAQEKKQGSRPSFGIVGGLTGSTIGGDDDSHNGLLIGWQAGVLMFIDAGSPDHFVFGAEANVSTEGTKRDAGIFDKVVFTYLNVPLVAQFRDPLGFFAEAGVQPGFLISAKGKYNGGGSYDLKDLVNTFDFGIPVGIGYIYKKKLGLNIRYIFGVSNINKADSAKDHNRVWALRLFYVFP
jgi:outer membrane protein with beta-barrel domain